MNDLRALIGSRPWLVLPIETNIRELHARTLLAAVAAERGFGVVIGRLADVPRYLPILPPSVLLETNVVGTQVSDVALKAGHVVTALDEEGLVQRDPDDYLTRRVSVAELERCARFFAWGQTHRQLVASKAPHLEERIIAVGSPRADLLRPTIRDIYRNETEALVRKHGRFILINTNFGTFNHQLGAQHRIREWATSGWSDTKEGADLLLRTLDLQHRLFEEFVELIHTLRSALPEDIGIILRPHPSENQTAWRKRVAGLVNVSIIHEGGVIPWLLASEALVQNSCTTGIEAVLLGKPSFAYLPVRDERVECTLPNDVSRRVDDKDLLIDSLIGIVNRAEFTPSFSSLDQLSSQISNLDGQLSCEAIVDEMATIAPPASAITNPRFIPTLVRLGRLKLKMRSFASGIRRGNVARERKLAAFVKLASPRIPVEEISRVLAALTSATGRFQDISCAILAPDVIVVSSIDPESAHLSASQSRTMVRP